MNAPANMISVRDIVAEARAWKMRMTERQAKSILSKNNTKIKRAMRNAAQEVVKEEVANYIFAQEDRELKLMS